MTALAKLGTAAVEPGAAAAPRLERDSLHLLRFALSTSIDVAGVLLPH